MTVEPTPQYVLVQRKASLGSKVTIVLLLLLLIGAAGFGIYTYDVGSRWQDRAESFKARLTKANLDLNTARETIGDLRREKGQVESERDFFEQLTSRVKLVANKLEACSEGIAEASVRVLDLDEFSSEADFANTSSFLNDVLTYCDQARSENAVLTDIIEGRAA